VLVRQVLSGRLDGSTGSCRSVEAPHDVIANL